MDPTGSYSYRERARINPALVLKGSKKDMRYRRNTRRVLQVEHAAQSLTRLRNKMLAKVATPPACLGVITGGGFGRQLSDEIYVVPINALGP